MEPSRSIHRSPAIGQFTTTRWSVVLTAADSNAMVAQQALEDLCGIYWYPLYAFARRRGNTPEDAQDLTQGFFAQILQKKYIEQADQTRGKFRTFLLTAFTHFLADEWDRAKRIKRGGDVTFRSLDAATAEERYRLDPVDQMDAARLFDRKWAMTLLERALCRLEEDFATNAQQLAFRELSPCLVGGRGEKTYAEIAARLGTTEAAVKMSISRMRRRYREILREEILQTVSTSRDAEEEYLALKAALRS